GTRSPRRVGRTRQGPAPDTGIREAAGPTSACSGKTRPSAASARSRRRVHARARRASGRAGSGSSSWRARPVRLRSRSSRRAPPSRAGLTPEAPPVKAEPVAGGRAQVGATIGLMARGYAEGPASEERLDALDRGEIQEIAHRPERPAGYGSTPDAPGQHFIAWFEEVDPDAMFYA